RIRLPRVEAGVLSQERRVEKLSQLLRDTPELRRDQLHVPATSEGDDARRMGECDAGGLSLRAQGAHEADAYPAPEECGGFHRSLSARHRSATQRTKAGADSLSVASEFEMRSDSAGRLSRSASSRPAICLRVPA